MPDICSHCGKKLGFLANYGTNEKPLCYTCGNPAPCRRCGREQSVTQNIVLNDDGICSECRKDLEVIEKTPGSEQAAIEFNVNLSKVDPSDLTFSKSIVSRALLALLLTFAFYLFAIGLVVTLLIFGITDLQDGSFHIRLFFFCFGGAGVILWSILPRTEEFRVPGILLRPSGHPDLFRLLGAIADASGQKLPRDVYLTYEMNAWVTKRGGFLGIGGYDVMGIGLPLLQNFTIAETTSIVAHEFGHFFGGDTSLGPLIFSTRSAILRTVKNLSKNIGILYFPFLWYGKLFLRITHAVSRRQELNADKFAAEVSSDTTFSGALKKITVLGPAFGVFMANEAGPILLRGYRPDIHDGFNQFLAVPAIADENARLLKEALESDDANVYDTHPSLNIRLSALSDASIPESDNADDRSATVLLESPDKMEAEVLNFIMKGAGKPLEQVAWEQVGEIVWKELWQERVHDYRSMLEGKSFGEIGQIFTAVHKSLRSKLSGEQAYMEAIGILGCAAVIGLTDQGWLLKVNVGRELELINGDLAIRPFDLVKELVDNGTTEQMLSEKLNSFGILEKPILLTEKLSEGDKESVDPDIS